MDHLTARREISVSQRETIVALHKASIPAREISRLLNINKRTVLRWIKRYTETRNAESLPRSGAPRHTTAEQDELIITTTQQQPLTNAVAVKIKTGLQINVQTLRNRLHSAGIHHRTPAVKPQLTQSHKEERLGFALEYYSMPDSFWNTVIFCDEKTFSSDDHGQLHCWRPDNTR